MAEFIENPRRTPRAPVRCEARVALRDGGFWAAPTSDYGPRGCQVSAPQRLEPGSRLFLELVNARVPGAFHLCGQVAWASNNAPWRAGIAFDEPSTSTASSFFERLAAAYPGLDTFGRAPERLPTDAPLAPAPLPGVEPLLSAPEREVLRELGAGLTLAALVERTGPSWPALHNAVFALIGRRYVTIGPPAPEHAEAWAPRLAGTGES